MGDHIRKNDVYWELFGNEVEEFIEALVPKDSINEVVNPFFLPRGAYHWLIQKVVWRKIKVSMKARENLRKLSRAEKEITKIEMSVAAARKKVTDDENKLIKALADVQIVVQDPKDPLDQLSSDYFPQRAKILAQQLKALIAKDERKEFDPEDQDEMRRIRHAWKIANYVGNNVYVVLQKHVAELATDMLYQGMSEDYAAAVKILEPVWCEFCRRRVRWT